MQIVNEYLCELPEPKFLTVWKAVAGEPPVIMLDDRREMIALLQRYFPARMPRSVGELEGYLDPQPSRPIDSGGEARTE